MKTYPLLDNDSLAKCNCIFAKVLDKYFPRDDTFIENMVTLCSSFIKNSESCAQFVKETSVLDVLHQACTANIEPHTYAFFLRLFTLITKGGFLNSAFYTHIKLFSRINDPLFQSNASVRFSWTVSCMTLCKHEVFLKLLLQQTEFHSTLKSLCHDPSLFVSEKAHEFIGHLILLLHAVDETKAMDLIRLFITEPLNNPPDARIAVLVMKSMLYQDASLAFPVIRNHITSLISVDLVKAFHLRKTWMEVFDVLVENKMLNDDQMGKLSLLAKELQHQELQEEAIDLSSWILTRMDTMDCDADKVLTGPILQYLASPEYSKHPHLLKCIHLIKCLKSKSSALKLLLQVLECDHSSLPAKMTVASLESCRHLLSEASRPEVTEVLRRAITLLQPTDMSYLVINQALQTVHASLCQLCTVGETVPDDMLSSLSASITRKLCDLRWEVRDSAAEAVGSLTQGVMKGWPAVVSWMRGSNLVASLSLSCRDSHSYVRATAMRSLSYAAAVPDLWKTFTASQTAELVEHAMKTALTDTEAFPRRSAVDLLTSLHQYHLYPSTEIFKVMAKLAHDFDWEVKLKVLKFWESEMRSLYEEPEMVNGTSQKRKVQDETTALERLATIGCCDFLKATLYDEDRSVQLAVCKVVQLLKEGLSLNIDLAPKKLKLEHSVQVGISKSETVEAFKQWLTEQNLNSLEMLASQSIDQYADNPSSFLDDVLGSLCRKVDVCDQSDTDQASAVDCY